MPPTASPAASIRSTLSGDSLDRLMTGGAADGTSMARQQQHLSFRERRRQFSRMKGQTIVDGGDATASTNLFDHALTIDTTAAAGGRGDHIHSTQRCRCQSVEYAKCAGNLRRSTLAVVSAPSATQLHQHHHLLPPPMHHQTKDLLPSPSAAGLLKMKYEANPAITSASSSSSPNSRRI